MLVLDEISAEAAEMVLFGAKYIHPELWNLIVDSTTFNPECV